MDTTTLRIGAVQAEIARDALDTADGRPGYSVDGGRLTVTDPARAAWVLAVRMDIYDENAADGEPVEPGERPWSTLARANRTMVDRVAALVVADEPTADEPTTPADDDRTTAVLDGVTATAARTFGADRAALDHPATATPVDRTPDVGGPVRCGRPTADRTPCRAIVAAASPVKRSADGFDGQPCHAHGGTGDPGRKRAPRRRCVVCWKRHGVDVAATVRVSVDGGRRYVCEPCADVLKRDGSPAPRTVDEATAWANVGPATVARVAERTTVAMLAEHEDTTAVAVAPSVLADVIRERGTDWTWSDVDRVADVRRVASLRRRRFVVDVDPVGSALATLADAQSVVGRWAPGDNGADRASRDALDPATLRTLDPARRGRLLAADARATDYHPRTVGRAATLLRDDARAYVAARPSDALDRGTQRAAGWSDVDAPTVADATARLAVARDVVRGQRAWEARHPVGPHGSTPATPAGVAGRSETVHVPTRAPDVRANVAARLADAQAHARGAERTLLGADDEHTTAGVERATAKRARRAERTPVAAGGVGRWTRDDARLVLSVVAPDVRAGRVTGRALAHALATLDAARTVLRHADRASGHAPADPAPTIRRAFPGVPTVV